MPLLEVIMPSAQFEKRDVERKPVTLMAAVLTSMLYDLPIILPGKSVINAVLMSLIRNPCLVLSVYRTIPFLLFSFSHQKCRPGALSVMSISTMRPQANIWGVVTRGFQ